MTSQTTIKREVEKLKEATGTKKGPNIMVSMWCVDRGDGKNGFARFSIWSPKDKTPLTDEEVKQMKQRRR